MPNNEIVTRKVQSTRTGTLFISLPKNFVLLHNLKKQDKVAFQLLEDKTLRIYPLTTFKILTTTQIIKVNP